MDTKTILLKTDFTLDLKDLFTGLELDIALIHICNPNNLSELISDLTVPLLILEACADFIGDILNYAIHENII
ncbi:hypothetical protein A1E_04040 [Rickettsia canadensis str. McKiel]|uniref:Uncharacterized protein n=2 Tax=Rickettsia canadensis TaxID=788 RepID=A8EZF2_RICCK|nr:hypothetical protein [Rickettsia canadensis]ABV73735.1 hypothetical protein A1E_04040 [Rickettsia canadensis str. McKiel]AFB21297.1 hypothetical protein RCA_03690 [Rickettsia canadensis str. CA410]